MKGILSDISSGENKIHYFFLIGTSAAYLERSNIDKQKGMTTSNPALRVDFSY
jgi:hypothetical protein